MAKLLLLSINDVNAEGLRILSAILHREGHASTMVFLKHHGGEHTFADGEEPDPYDWVGVNRQGQCFRYCRGSQISEKERSLLLSLIEEIRPDAIGMSVTTPFRKPAAEIAALIKRRFDVPIIWGGPDPTISTEDCLAHCDFACIGEGEKTIVDIASALDRDRDLRDVNNLAYLADGRCVRNPIHPLIHDLNSIPFKDIDPRGKFLIENDALVSDFPEISYSHNYNYHLFSARGCPHSCSYCCEDWYKKLYHKQIFLRRRSVANVIRELKIARDVVDYKHVQFEDEVFSYDQKWLLEFRDAYKKEINVPFECYIYPNAKIEEQLTILRDAGLDYTCLALQSGSERINKDVFSRIFNREHFIRTAQLLHQMGIRYYTDVITFNPFETRKDLHATLDVLTKLPQPFHLCVNKLYALKGTKIFDLVQDRKKSRKGILANRVFVYYARLFWLATTEPPKNVRWIERARIFQYVPSLFRWLERAKAAWGNDGSALRKASQQVMPYGSLRRKTVKAAYFLLFDRQKFRERMRR